MKRILTWAIAFALFPLQFAEGQTLTVFNTKDLSKENLQGVVGHTSDEIYILSSQETEIHYLVFDYFGNHLRTMEAPEKINKQHLYSELYFAGKIINLYMPLTPKPGNYDLGYTICGSDQNEPIKIGTFNFAYIINWVGNPIQASISPDGKTLLFAFTERKESLGFHFIILNENMELVADQKVDYTLKLKDFAPQTFRLDNNGDIFVIGDYDQNEETHAGILKYNYLTKEQEISYTETKLVTNEYKQTIGPVILKNDSNLICVIPTQPQELKLENGNSSPEILAVEYYHKKTGKFAGRMSFDLSKDASDQLLLNNNKNSFDYTVRDAYALDNGELDVLMEFRPHSRFEAPPAGGENKLGDILTLSVDHDNLRFNVVKKTQSSKDGYPSFCSFKTNNAVYMLYNDYETKEGGLKQIELSKGILNSTDISPMKNKFEIVTGFGSAFNFYNLGNYVVHLDDNNVLLLLGKWKDNKNNPKNMSMYCNGFVKLGYE